LPKRPNISLSEAQSLDLVNSLIRGSGDFTCPEIGDVYLEALHEHAFEHCPWARRRQEGTPDQAENHSQCHKEMRIKRQLILRKEETKQI